MEKVLIINIDESAELFKALASDSRIEILKLLKDKMLNVNDIAEQLNIPSSTATVNIQKLEEVGLIATEYQPGNRGSQKLCSRAYNKIIINLNSNNTEEEDNIINVMMPIGNYYDFKVFPTCGLLSDSGIIGLLDDTRSFYEPEHIYAQLIWFRRGYIEYRFPNKVPYGAEIKSLEISAELCSEAPFYNMDWPSDITLWVNDKEIGTWISPGDFGGERGTLTPEWWGINNTQYGSLKVWRVNGNGSYIDGNKVSDILVKDLEINNKDYINVRFGIKDDANNVGGINLFGSKFGNYEQDILMKIEYQYKQSTITPGKN
ncbi:ArsR/SmtB family transcription factor [Thermoanaerobacterium thermosaccharolyticum]|uniref:Putative transcriptional regulator n=1 Tax=Thermoanaerobacterium thermosaccharolyticum M0795 TaxID=698948 RepID=L0IKT0_THETR|nr:helix-turn-helix domain-containing protein [Thermoanaerobacterium thermosaccharolyticum]AGB19354.1 putative transcriptional regulator [Thermoanaerobacterium thermosaccharolyticum M0795]